MIKESFPEVSKDNLIFMLSLICFVQEKMTTSKKCLQMKADFLDCARPGFVFRNSQNAKVDPIFFTKV